MEFYYYQYAVYPGWRPGFDSEYQDAIIAGSQEIGFFVMSAEDEEIIGGNFNDFEMFADDFYQRQQL